MERVLEGDLARFDCPDLLNLLAVASHTGVLVLERREQETKIFLRSGRPVFACSTHDDLRFGSLLVRLGKVKGDRMEPALLKRRGGRRRLGQVLVSEQLLSQADLASLLKVQVSEVIFDAFTWGEGVFTFWTQVPPPSNVVTLEMDLQSLLMEGIRRLDISDRVAGLVPDQSLVAEAIVNPDRVKASASLTPDEWKVFFLVDGRRTVEEICRTSGTDEGPESLQVLWKLQRARFIALAPPAPEPQPQKSSADTQKVPVVSRTQKAPVPVDVEFVTPVRGTAVQDDTKEIVSPLAVQYQADVRHVTVSRLVLLQDGQETSFPLTRDTYTVGRHRNNDIVIADPKVSSFHARIDRTPDGFRLVDLKSRNGSFVNGKRVDSTVLRTADELRLGTAKLLYKIDYTAA
jgi:hypothetical protein